MNAKRYLRDLIIMAGNLFSILFNLVFFLAVITLFVSVTLDVLSYSFNANSIVRFILFTSLIQMHVLKEILELLRSKQWTLSVYPKQMKVYKAPAPKETKPDKTSPKKPGV